VITKDHPDPETTDNGNPDDPCPSGDCNGSDNGSPDDPCNPSSNSYDSCLCDPPSCPGSSDPPSDVPPESCGVIVCSGLAIDRPYIVLNKNTCKCEKIDRPWYYDSDKDEYHDPNEEIKIQKESPGIAYEKTTKGEDCDDNNLLVTTNCYKEYFIDNDDDGYHSGTIRAKTQGPYKTTTLGPDCDDNLTTGANVHKLNKCGKCEVEPVSGVCDGNPCKVSVSFGKNVKISSINKCSLQLLKEITDKLGINEFQISSAFRSGTDQARVMFNNIQRFGVAKQKALYGANGDRVIDAYSAALAAGKSNDEIKQAMLDEINTIGAYNVSNHSGDPNTLTVIDIDPNSIPLANRSEFVNEINQAISNGDVSKFLHPGNSRDPAYHIEIKVENCNLKNCN
jgi:hypothetical protein